MRGFIRAPEHIVNKLYKEGNCELWTLRPDLVCLFDLADDSVASLGHKLRVQHPTDGEVIVHVDYANPLDSFDMEVAAIQEVLTRKGTNGEDERD